MWNIVVKGVAVYVAAKVIGRIAERTTDHIIDKMKQKDYSRAEHEFSTRLPIGYNYK
ncbi:MAG: hypothetical protein MJZ15_00625 [Bacteroidales bacterium]|nr:hypothetical protein [Bacteroidales bacterium]